MTRLLLLFIFAIFINACSPTKPLSVKKLADINLEIKESAGSPGVDHKNGGGSSELEKINEELNEELNEEFDKHLGLCDEKMKLLRDSFLGAGRSELTLATIGILAGSVVVPALAAKTSAARSTIAAWGGVSGAVNAAQYSIHQKGASAASIGVVYENIRTEIVSATEDFVNGDDKDAKVKAIIKLSTACKFPRLPSVQSPEKPTGNG